MNARYMIIPHSLAPAPCTYLNDSATSATASRSAAWAGSGCLGLTKTQLPTRLGVYQGSFSTTRPFISLPIYQVQLLNYYLQLKHSLQIKYWLPRKYSFTAQVLVYSSSIMCSSSDLYSSNIICNSKITSPSISSTLAVECKHHLVSPYTAPATQVAQTHLCQSVRCFFSSSGEFAVNLVESTPCY